ncbi:hypothetical protein RDT67_18715 [Serratia fonticola]|uniref:Uncharacterized protein n=1 Tax=Serratia fonticola TaxID=47917 RepID=A0AAJ2D8M7_SERFO|nr:hypothetical protein [Serratia fonticola]MDQ9128452.1 hypothetical protein [Serratia fonticola]
MIVGVIYRTTGFGLKNMKLQHTVHDRSRKGAPVAGHIVKFERLYSGGSTIKTALIRLTIILGDSRTRLGIVFQLENQLGGNEIAIGRDFLLSSRLLPLAGKAVRQTNSTQRSGNG